MENSSYSSYPDSQTSSPRFREIECDNQSWEEPIPNYKVKLMCSYGGKIQPRPHDNQLSYVGGDTKIISVDRRIKFGDFVAKLSGLCDFEVWFKYQLPGEDLDALISVTNDEDLEHMMLEYDRLYRASAKPARLRLFLFTANPPTSEASLGSGKSDQQWFVEALNSVPTADAKSDFIFGSDKGAQPAVVAPSSAVRVPSVNVESEVRGGEQVVAPDQALSLDEIKRQINELQRMQISGQEQIVYQQKSDGSGGLRAYGEVGDYYTTQKVAENVVQAQQGVPMQMPVYWQDQNQMSASGYQVPGGRTGAEQQQQQVYIIPTPEGGMYQTSADYRQMTGQVGQAQPQVQTQVYYGTQRIVPDAYREQQVYNSVQAPVAQTKQQPAVGVYAEGMSGQQPTEGGYVVAYDGYGRQVYYSAAGVAAPTYQVVSAAAAPVTQVAGVNQEGKVPVVKPN